MAFDAATHPRPQFRRGDWLSLDGEWDFAVDREALWKTPEDARFERTILVPFAPETKKSGIAEQAFFKACWYRKRISTQPLNDGERLMLHFGAVDDEAEVWANGKRVAH